MIFAASMDNTVSRAREHLERMVRRGNIARLAVRHGFEPAVREPRTRCHVERIRAASDCSTSCPPLFRPFGPRSPPSAEYLAWFLRWRCSASHAGAKDKPIWFGTDAVQSQVGLLVNGRPGVAGLPLIQSSDTEAMCAAFALRCSHHHGPPKHKSEGNRRPTQPPARVPHTPDVVSNGSDGSRRAWLRCASLPPISRLRKNPWLAVSQTKGVE